MLKDSVVRLADGSQLYIIEDLDFAGRKFILGADVNVQRDEIDAENLVFQEVIIKDGEPTIVPIENDAEAESFGKLMISKIINEK